MALKVCVKYDRSKNWQTLQELPEPPEVQGVQYCRDNLTLYYVNGTIFTHLLHAWTQEYKSNVSKNDACNILMEVAPIFCHNQINSACKPRACCQAT